VGRACLAESYSNRAATARDGAQGFPAQRFITSFTRGGAGGLLPGQKFGVPGCQLETARGVYIGSSSWGDHESTKK